jgi:hypothetical protein
MSDTLKLALDLVVTFGPNHTIHLQAHVWVPILLFFPCGGRGGPKGGGKLRSIVSVRTSPLEQVGIVCFRCPLIFSGHLLRVL